MQSHNDPVGDSGTPALAGTRVPHGGAPRDLLADMHHQDPALVHGAPIDIRGYWRVLLKHRWIVLGVAAAVIVGVLVATLMSTSIYRATTMLQIEREALKVVEFAGDQRRVEDGSAVDFYQTQYELLKSRAIAERVVEGLAPEDRRALGDGTTAGNAGQDTATSGAAVATIQRQLVVAPVRNSRLVRVHFDSQEPELSARVVNGLADAFIESNLARRFDASSYARTYLEERLEQLKARLEDSERELVQFAQQEQIVGGGEGRSLSGQNLADLNTALAESQSHRIRAEARWQQARASSGAGLPADLLAGSIVRTLQERRTQLDSEYQEKLQVYKPGYPDMVRLKGQIDEISRQIQEEYGGIRRSAEAEYRAALAQERLLLEKMGVLREDVLDLDRRSIQYNIIKREVDTNSEIYDALLQRYKEIGVAGGVSTNNISVVDRAQVPGSRFKPNLARNLAFALLGGLLLGVLLAFAIEHFDDTVHSTDEMEKIFNLPVLGTVPMLEHSQPQEAATDLRSGFSEAYRSVRTALQFSTDAGTPRTLLISSASPGEGKSTSALLLARNFAQLGKSVLLIDADLRNPSLHRTLGIDNSSGLSNFLSGAADFDGLATTDKEESGVAVLSSGPLPPNPAELLSSPRMKSLIDMAADRYDQVILDGPPVIGLADVPILSHVSAGTLLMVAAGKTKEGALRAALKRLDGARGRVIGGVLTMYQPHRAGATYSYGDYAYYNYGAGPGQKTPRD